MTEEGGAGEAVALAAADRVLILENATYSVISPEGAASILWKAAKFAEKSRRKPAPHRSRSPGSWGGGRSDS